jgi:hypothetical protein
MERKCDAQSMDVAWKWDDAFDEGSYFRRTRATG